MNRKVQYLFLLIVAFAICSVFGDRPVNAEMTSPLPEVEAPAGFCQNQVGWQLDLSAEWPLNPYCYPGEYFVDVEGTLEGPFEAFHEAVFNLQDRGGVGTLWFQPQTEWQIFLPVVSAPLQQITVTAPNGFCQNQVGWVIDLANQIPADPGCGLGTWFVIVETVVSDPIPGFAGAVANLASRSGVGTLWFQPN